MNNKFWDSEANKFTLYGALFGILFPIIATLIEAVQLGGVTTANLIAVQQNDPLLWIIDSAPFFLGIFARFAGWRQDQLKRIIRENIAIPEQVQESLEDSRQFAGVLTFLAAALISVVLFVVIFWLQSLITTALETLPVASPTAGPNVVAVAAPTIIQIGDTPTPPVVVTLSETAVPLAVDNTTVLATAQVVATPVALATATVAFIPPTETAPAVAVAEPPTASPTVANVIHLGTMSRVESDCIFPSEIAAELWQEALGIEVTVEEFTTTDDLFRALATADDPQHIDLTLCYVDPVDRSYLRQYPGALQIIGDAFWETADGKLLAMRSGAPLAVDAAAETCINNYLRNQLYDVAAINDLGATEWLATNREMAMGWLDCSVSPE